MCACERACVQGRPEVSPLHACTWVQGASKVSVSEVDDAMSSLKAAMMDGTADRNQVIDMLSLLLRGRGGETSQVGKGGECFE